MGTSCAPFLANLFLFYYEYNFMVKCEIERPFLCDKLKYVYRYIDDISLINDYNVFKHLAKLIYPKELSLEKINSSSNFANILDISVKLKNGKAITTLYDKRREFNFKCNNFPDIRGNVPKHAAYNTIKNEKKRLTKIISRRKDIKEEIARLSNTLSYRGYDESVIKHMLK